MLGPRLVLLVCLSLAYVPPAFTQDSSALFAAAERAFESEDYAEALRLFSAARAAGSAGPSSAYNIGVSQYRLGLYEDAVATFAALAAEFPALRELAEYNRGLALRASGRTRAARDAFRVARGSNDEKIAALARAQLAQLGAAARTRGAHWSGYVAGGVGYDDNVALVDAPLLPTGQSPSSPLVEALGVLTRRFAAPLRIDATGYWVRYADADQYDQSAVRLALVAERGLGAWRLEAGPTLARSTLDGEGFEELAGVDLQARRAFGERMVFDARVVYDDSASGDARYSYLEGSRRQLRLGVQYVGDVRLRLGYDLERNDRADPGVSPTRKRWSLAHQRQIGAWTTGAALARRVSRYREASTPREETLLQLTLRGRRDLRRGWSVSAEYGWSDNDSTESVYSYEGERVTIGVGRGF